jgi:hypothetical protein
MADANKAAAAILDFTDVKDGGATFNKKRVPAGDYLAKVVKCADAPTKKKEDGSGGEPQWLYTVELVEKFTDRRFPYYCKLQNNQLWKIRNLFLAAGVTIPKKKVKLDPNRIVGKLIGITLEDDEYDGKAQSNIAATFPATELEGADDDVTDEDELDDEEDEPTADVADDEDDEEEPEPAPVRRKASIPAQRKASPKAAAQQVDDDELEELDLEDI